MNTRGSWAAALLLSIAMSAGAAPPRDEAPDLAAVIEAAVRRFVIEVTGGAMDALDKARRTLCADTASRTQFVDQLAADTLLDRATIERQLRRILNCPASAGTRT